MNRETARSRGKKTSFPREGDELELEVSAVRKFEIAIVQKYEGKWNRNSADEDTELKSGDLIEVKLGFDSWAPRG